MSEEKKICYKCIHFNKRDDECWCIEQDNLTWNNAPYCKEYKEETKCPNCGSKTFKVMSFYNCVKCMKMYMLDKGQLKEVTIKF